MGRLHEREVTMAPAPLKLDVQCVCACVFFWEEGPSVSSGS